LVVFFTSELPPPNRTLTSLNRMVKPLAPMDEKLSVNFCFMASMAVLMPTSAMIPNAIMDTVIPVRTLLLLTVRYDNDITSVNFITLKISNHNAMMAHVYKKYSLLRSHWGNMPRKMMMAASPVSHPLNAGVVSITCASPSLKYMAWMTLK